MIVFPGTSSANAAAGFFTNRAKKQFKTCTAQDHAFLHGYAVFTYVPGARCGMDQFQRVCSCFYGYHAANAIHP